MAKKTKTTTNDGAMRAIDANLNRAAEGIRVVEDVLRFHDAAAGDVAALRKLRHGIREITPLFPGGGTRLLSSRDSDGDVARAAKAGEHSNLHDIVSANMKRAQEALRTLEELSRTVAPGAAGKFAELRFQSYQIEKKIAPLIGMLRRREKMPPSPFVYAIADFMAFRAKNWRFLDGLLDGDVGMIQLRDSDPDITDIEQFRNAEKLRKRMADSSTRLIINNRADIAAAVEADGVHVGQEDLPIHVIRDLFPDLIVGVSTHNLDEMNIATSNNTDYIAVGAIFQSPTKPELGVVGTGFLKNMVSASSVPVIAIGGITVENVWEVFEAGASGAAMISALTESKDIGKTLRTITKSTITHKATK